MEGKIRGSGLGWILNAFLSTLAIVIRLSGCELTTLQIYTLGYIKLIGTVTKYVPQMYLNYKLKSTVGWSIWQVLLDFTGGILSLLELVIDASMQNDWSGITGNPAKFGLSNISIIFDVIFIVQHYVLYPDGGAKEEVAPLLPDGV